MVKLMGGRQALGLNGLLDFILYRLIHNKGLFGFEEVMCCDLEIFVQPPAAKEVDAVLLKLQP